MLHLITNFAKKGNPPEYLQSISTLSQHYLQNNDYQNSNIKKVGDPILKQICKINILAHVTGAENQNRPIPAGNSIPELGFGFFDVKTSSYVKKSTVRTCSSGSTQLFSVKPHFLENPQMTSNSKIT